MRKRLERQEETRKIVRRERIRTQRDLVDRLRTLGYVCTQATVSRDISEMGLRKLPEGVYVLSEDLHLQRMISDLVLNVVRSDNLVLVKASAGTASGVAAALDQAELPEVIGSIAGDDTVLVITHDVVAAEQLFEHLDKFRSRR
jgi:transcriptional regulator of arginine metabolism